MRIFSQLSAIALCGFLAFPVSAQYTSVLQQLSKAPDFGTYRISSYDRSGGNNDRIENIKPGETKVLAEIDGPGAITHIWNTIDAEKYYSRMLILRFYWDGQETPSIEVPLGDFFGVGHGLNIPFDSLPVNVSSEGRARNCYWYMPFEKSAKITVTHEGFYPVRAFYYYIDYQKYDSFPEDSLYFHAHYRQKTPNPEVNLKGINRDGETNYLLMETEGRGLYVGTVQSVQINRDGWYGEGDDMFFVDGAEMPTMTGTGTEDYFNDAWGFREFSYAAHGVTIWEGYSKGDRGTAYKWHLFDPVAFQKSLRATIEHGHANDRQDDMYSVAFWYQTLPSPEPPPMPDMVSRLPDEGQLYAKQISINENLTAYREAGHEDFFAYALDHIKWFVERYENADEYGYWSMRRGTLLKQLGEIDEAESAFESALNKSDKEDKYNEHDVDHIHWVAERELPVIEESKHAHLYFVADDVCEVFIDGESIAKQGGRDRLRDHEIQLRRGKHIIALKCENKGGGAGVALQLSHRKGYVFTDSSWKVSTTESKKWTNRKFDDSDWENAERVCFLGQAPWNSSRSLFAFAAPVLFAEVVWAPGGAKENQTVYFRKEFRVR